MTTPRGATSAATTAPAATKASSPISIAGQTTAPAPSAAGAAQQRSFELQLRPVAVHRVVVGEGHAGADEDVVLDHRARRQVAASLHAGAGADLDAGVDRAEAADRRAGPDPGPVANLGVVADPGAGADLDARRGSPRGRRSGRRRRSSTPVAEQQPGCEVGGLQRRPAHRVAAPRSFAAPSDRRHANGHRAPQVGRAATRCLGMNAAMKIGVVGLGYVGLPLAVAFAEAGHEVVGLDSDRRKVDGLNSGRSHIEDVAERQSRRARRTAAGQWRPGGPGRL